ncbi:MAG: hypothetical protein ACK5L3_12190 [Oscillospiraceae bacterium]
MVSNIYAGLNAVIRAINTLSFKVPDWVPGIGGGQFGFNFSELVAPQIPKLARGAVIPPNREFAAILGDQTSGRNLELPEALLRQIMREEGGGREITIRFTGSLAELVRILKPEIEKEDTRTGGYLITGGAY